MAAQLTYPYIMQQPDILGGVPIIKGSRIAVRTIAGYYQMGMSVDEILLSLPSVQASQVHAALSYYFDHQAEIDKDLAEASDVEHWKTFLQSRSIS